MELYASGFNAWNQLILEGPVSQDEPEDLRQFTRVLTGNTIQPPRASLSHTTVAVDGSTRTAGYVPKEHQALQASDPLLYATLAEASNGFIATLSPDGTLQQHQSLAHLLLHLEQQHHKPQTPSTTTSTNHTAANTSLPRFKQLVSYATGFAALTHPTGDVYTWGDERYGACLGRDIPSASASASTTTTTKTSADQPGHVTALQDLPTGPARKVAAGGYVLAALTAGDDLYLWGGGGGGGGQPGGRKGVPAGMVGDEPTPVDLDGRDIEDVAIGDSHLVVLTTEGEVFVVGDNGNGQLGLPEHKYAESWTRVELGLQDGRRAVGVAAGPRNSFIVVQKGAT